LTRVSRGSIHNWSASGGREREAAGFREFHCRKPAREHGGKHGVSEATLYNWKAKFGGLDVSDAKRLRALEEENNKLKRLFVNADLKLTHFLIIWPE